MDDAFCGGGDNDEGLYSTAIPIQGSAVSMIKATIFMGDPRYIYGLSYEIGTCRAAGVSQCPVLMPFSNFFFFRGLPLTRYTVCSSLGWLPMRICCQDPLLLRRHRSILLLRQQRCHPPRLWKRVRTGSFGVREKQARHFNRNFNRKLKWI
jgi:hypothetical protein